MIVAPQAYVLDLDPKNTALMYVDEHVMTHPEMLINVLRAANSETHPLRKHVLAKWASGRREYQWLYELTRDLLAEQAYRFSVKNEEMWDNLQMLYRQGKDNKPPRFVQLIDCKLPGDAVKAYRNYYLRNVDSACWTKRKVPDWWNAPVQGTLNLVTS